MPNFGIVDTHVHLWDPHKLTYPWLRGNALLNRPYLTEDYQAACGDVEVTTMVFAECWVNRGLFEAEVRLVEGLAVSDPRIKAIIAQASLEEGAAVLPVLKHLKATTPLLRGVRRIVEFEPELDFCLRPPFIEGTKLLGALGLSLCINHSHMEYLLRFADLIGDVPLMLDHCGKPAIREGRMEPWRQHMRALAAHPNVMCKLSGLPGEADHTRWTELELRPYIDAVVEAFGFDRLVYGGDWPACLRANGIPDWVNLLDRSFSGVTFVRLETMLSRQCHRFLSLGFKRMTVLPRRDLGRNGLSPTVLGLGGAPLGDLFERLPEQQADYIVKTALEAGITFFDTAPFYGHGLSELRIGRGLRQIDRYLVIVSTKVGRVYRRPVDPAVFSTGSWAGGLHFEPRFDYSARGILRSYKDSLVRLGLNRVDCLVIHDFENRLMSEPELQHHRSDFETSGWATLKQLKDGGEIDAISAGINDCSIMAYFGIGLISAFSSSQIPTHSLDQTPLSEFSECQRRGMSIVKGSPYASGILATGPLPGAVYDYEPATPAILEKTRRILSVCDEFGVSLQAASLQFLLAHLAVVSVIPGVTSRQMVAANVFNLAVAIPAAFWAKLKALELLLADAPVPQER